MLVFPEMLIEPATKAGIRTPPLSEVMNNTWPSHEYPHWTVFCNIQIGGSLPDSSSHHVNAEIISKIPDNKIKTVSVEEMMSMGLQVNGWIAPKE